MDPKSRTTSVQIVCGQTPPKAARDDSHDENNNNNRRVVVEITPSSFGECAHCETLK